MTKDELTQAFLQLSRGFPQVAEQLAEHFMPEQPAVQSPLVPPPGPVPPTVLVEVPDLPAVETPVSTPAPEAVNVPFPSAEHIETLKAD